MKTPDALRKRDLLHGAKKSSSSEKNKLIQAFIKKNWISDAIDFSTHDESFFDDIEAKCVESGDVFLLLKLSHILEKNINSSQLVLTAKKAESLGKIRYALLAYEKLENESEVERLAKLIENDGDRINSDEEEEIYIPDHTEEIE